MSFTEARRVPGAVRARAARGLALALAVTLASCKTIEGLQADIATIGETPYVEAEEPVAAEAGVAEIPSGPLTTGQAQQMLANRGYDVGAVDGRWGPKSAGALRNFQADCALPRTGELDATTTEALRDVDRSCDTGGE